MARRKLTQEEFSKKLKEFKLKIHNQENQINIFYLCAYSKLSIHYL